jgi:hypothetical protein
MEAQMAIRTALLAATLAATVGSAVPSTTIAQGVGTGIMQGGGSQKPESSGRSSSAQQQGPMCSGMCSAGSCPCMQDGRTSSEMMHHDMMHGGMGGGMMNQGMMRGGAGHGMMMRGDAGSGMGTLFGSHVVPTLNLSVDDVRGFLTARLDRLNNKRLKLGEVKADDSTITADVVTVDNSLVQRLKVDRHTGNIEYEN